MNNRMLCSFFTRRAPALLFFAGCFFLCHGKQRIEGVAAFVGDSTILLSELDAYVFLKMGGVADTAVDSLAMTMLRHQAIDELIDGKVLVVRAEKDTNIRITENELDAHLDSRIQMIIKQNNLTPKEFEEVLTRHQGITLSQFRAEVRSQIRHELLRQKVQQYYISSAPPSRSEVESFYREYKDSLPPAGNSVLLSALSVNVTPSKEIRQKAFDKITAIKKRLDDGQDFGEVARKYSECPNAPMGGDLGYIAKGTLSELTFEEKIFSMRPRETSDIFETRLGFHIIRIEDRRDQTVHVKQIFVAVRPSGELVERTIALLDSVSAAAGTREAFVMAVRAYSTDDISKSRDGIIGWKEVSFLEPAIRSAIDTLDTGMASGPVRSGNVITIYRVEDRQESRSLTLEDDRNEIAVIAERIYAQKKLIELVRKWRQDTFIDIRL